VSTRLARLEGAPVHLAASIAAVPVAGLASWPDGQWTLTALAVLVATVDGVTALTIPGAPAWPDGAPPPAPDEAPGAALSEAERDRLVASVFVGTSAAEPWRLLCLRGRGQVPDGAERVVEVGRFEWTDGRARIARP
jgi:hypothetical protein